MIPETFPPKYTEKIVLECVWNRKFNKWEIPIGQNTSSTCFIWCFHSKKFMNYSTRETSPPSKMSKTDTHIVEIYLISSHAREKGHREAQTQVFGHQFEVRLRRWDNKSLAFALECNIWLRWERPLSWTHCSSTCW